MYVCQRLISLTFPCVCLSKGWLPSLLLSEKIDLPSLLLLSVCQRVDYLHFAFCLSKVKYPQFSSCLSGRGLITCTFTFLLSVCESVDYPHFSSCLSVIYPHFSSFLPVKGSWPSLILLSVWQRLHVRQLQSAQYRQCFLRIMGIA